MNESKIKVFVTALVIAWTAFVLVAGFQSCTDTSKPVDNTEAKKRKTAGDTVRVDTAQLAQAWICSTKEEPASKAVGPKSKFYPSASVLKIGFVGGTAVERQRIKDAYYGWSLSANLLFVYPATGPYNHRWSFQPGAAYSYIGKDCEMVGQNYVTGNVGFQNQLNSVSEHETGHSIGLGHEHLNPQGGICLNEAVVIADMAAQGWSEAQTRFNIIDKYKAADVYSTAFDNQSVMGYNLRSSWVCNGIPITAGNKISAGDRAFIAQRYPGIMPPPATVTLTSVQVSDLKNAANMVKVAADSLKNKTVRYLGQ